MKSNRVHRIVEYIKQINEFPFDTSEVMEELDKVLYFFDIHEELTPEERKLLEDDLSRLALEEEMREVEYIAKQEEEKLF